MFRDHDAHAEGLGNARDRLPQFAVADDPYDLAMQFKNGMINEGKMVAFLPASRLNIALVIGQMAHQGKQ